MIFCLIIFSFFLFSCNSSREFWRYIVEDEVSLDIIQEEDDEPDFPKLLSPHNVKVVYNDGKSTTEVLIPILSSGQQIVLDHNASVPNQGIDVMVPPPSDVDEDIENSYIVQGYPINKNSKPISIIATQQIIKEHVRKGNFGLALQYVNQILKRYPKHPQSLRTKGSLLLKIGEREAALKTYYEAQDVEPSRKVEKQILKIEKNLE